MSPNQISEAASQIAGKDDRYLMIVAVLLLIVGGALIIRYLAKFLERLISRQETQGERLISRQETQGDKMIEVVSKNTAVIERNTEALDRHTRVFTKGNA